MSGVCIYQQPKTLESLLRLIHGIYGYVCEETRIWCLREPVKKDGLWTRQCCSEGGYDSDRKMASDPPSFLFHLIL